MYIGSFIKNPDFRDCVYRKEELDIHYKLDKKIYMKVQKDLYKVLGKREKYNALDAIHYFQSRYQAETMDLKNFFQKRDKNLLIPSYNFLKDILICLFPYNYIYQKELDGLNSEAVSFEKTTVIVINIIKNLNLKKEGSKIIKHEKNLLKTILKMDILNESKNEDEFLSMQDSLKKNFVNIYKNIVITISYRNDWTINSMKVVIGELLIPNIEYALEFFRKRS